MAIQYFPRIDDLREIEVIKELNAKPVNQASELSATNHPAAYYYATAAITVPEAQLKQFRAKVMDVAYDLGFPAKLNSNRARELDQRISNILFQDLELVPAEAANKEVWNFLTLVVLPDIAKWRYPNEKQTPDYDRWLGSNRNVIRKLWWREAVLGHDLNSQIGEDEAVGIMERPMLSGQAPIARAMVKALLSVEKEFPKTARSELLRAGAVNLRRYLPFTAFEMLSETKLEEFVLNVFHSSSQAYIEKQEELKKGQ
ncbi:MAG: hypothetical protein HLX50_16875 [Alteromonadaceae bacterium]|nr:hypothetical protein [Alteromonadaceae bacterium]